MHKTKLPLLTILILLILLLYTGCAKQQAFIPVKADKGVLDLTKTDLNQSVLALDGSWEFYWGMLLSPEEITEAEKNRDFIDVPRTWNRYKINDKEISGDGYATYRLTIYAQDNMRLGIKIPRIFTAYKLFVNGKILASAGVVGNSRGSMVPQYLPQVTTFDSQDQNEIVIQVSNFYHRSSGLLESIVIGSEKQILGMQYKSIAFELLLFGGLMVMGLYHIALFFFRKKNTSNVYFGLFCLFVAIRTLLSGERFLVYLIPNFNWEIAHKIQTLTFYLGVPLILVFFKLVFPKYFHSIVVSLTKWISIAFGLVVLLTPAKIFTVVNPAYQIFTLITIAYIICIFINILHHKEKGIGLIIIGALALLISSINDILYLSIWVNDQSSNLLREIIRIGNLSTVGQLLFALSVSLVLARRFSDSLEQEEQMTIKLREMNLNLDELVKKRTHDLEDSRKKIEFQNIELEKANQSLQLLTLKDPLTGLWNRRHYEHMLKVEWNLSIKLSRPISLLVIDIDNYKEYNDFYGHMAGDNCLVNIADTIRVLSDNMSFRYGGEEFTVIIPGKGKEEAMKMADLIRTKIEEKRISHRYSSAGSWVTVSIGCATMVANIECSQEMIFLAADKAMYRAKDAGKNRVAFYE